MIWKKQLSLIPLATLFIYSVVQMGALYNSGAVHNNDFKHLWLGSRILAEGGDPYDVDTMMMAARQSGFDGVNPYVYLPATGFMMWPVCSLSFETAWRVWFWGNFILAWLCVAFGSHFLKLERRQVAQIAASSFLVFALPFHRQMTAGQMNVIMLAGLILALGLLIRCRELSAGGVIGALAAFKIAPLFLIVALAGMKRTRAALSATVAFGVISFAALSMDEGVEAFKSSIPVISQMGYGRSTWSGFGMDYYRDPFNQSLNSLFHHLFTADGRDPNSPRWIPFLNLGSFVANALTWIVSLLMLAGFASTVAQSRRRPYFRIGWGEAESLLFLIGAALMLLLPSLMWDHYSVQAVIFILWIFGSREMIRRPLRWLPAIAMLALLSYPVFHLQSGGASGFGLVVISIRLWGTLLALVLLYSEWWNRMRDRLEQG